VSRTVVVTGASSGIGEACALRLAAAGWRVYGGVRSTDARSSLRARGVEPIELDVTSPEQIAAAADAVGATLDGLVDNAGIAIAAPLELVPVDELRRQLEVNVVGQVAVTQAFLPLIRAGRGRIVNMGSIAGRMATPFTGAYSASKFALEALTDALRLELQPWGISVSIIEPGAVATPIWEKAAKTAETMLRAVPPETFVLYAEAIEALKKAAAHAARNAVDPVDVARAVEHALTASRPRTRYVVGREAKIRAAMALFVPDRVRDNLVAKAMRLPKTPPSTPPKAGEGAWG